MRSRSPLAAARPSAAGRDAARHGTSSSDSSAEARQSLTRAPFPHRRFDALLDNRLLDSFQILRGQPESPFHLVGLGIAAFLKAILSREDAELREVRRPSLLPLPAHPSLAPR